jgi:hypothetical protein
VPDYDAATYGDRMAEVYEGWFGVPSDAGDTVALLKDLTGPEPMLELGIALPLARRECEVHGVEASEAMVTKLRGKTGGEGIPVAVGNFVRTSTGEARAGNRSRPRASNTSRSTKGWIRSATTCWQLFNRCPHRVVPAIDVDQLSGGGGPPV